MKVSALICSLWVDDRKPQILNKCIKKLKGADEILSLVTEPNTRLGFADSWNRLAKIATGDYLIFIGDNTFLQEGNNLKDLCIRDTVTFPLINGNFSKAPALFCIPRSIYEKIGLYDDTYNKGVHWEESDFWRTILEKKIKYQGITSVNFKKPSSGRSINKIKNGFELKELNRLKYLKKWGDTELPNLDIPIPSRDLNFILKDKIHKIGNLILEFPFLTKEFIHKLKNYL